MPGDTTYLLARVTGLRYGDGALRITTSFPVPYRVRTLSDGPQTRGFVDCIGASASGSTRISPVPPDDSRAVRLRAGQNTAEVARVVLELAPGNLLPSHDGGPNDRTEIVAPLGFGSAPARPVIITVPSTRGATYSGPPMAAHAAVPPTTADQPRQSPAIPNAVPIPGPQSPSTDPSSGAREPQNFASGAVP